jgi:hypothetical protein
MARIDMSTRWLLAFFIAGFLSVILITLYGQKHDPLTRVDDLANSTVAANGVKTTAVSLRVPAGHAPEVDSGNRRFLQSPNPPSKTALEASAEAAQAAAQAAAKLTGSN